MTSKKVNTILDRFLLMIKIAWHYTASYSFIDVAIRYVHLTLLYMSWRRLHNHHLLKLGSHLRYSLRHGFNLYDRVLIPVLGSGGERNRGSTALLVHLITGGSGLFEQMFDPQDLLLLLWSFLPRYLGSKLRLADIQPSSGGIFSIFWLWFFMVLPWPGIAFAILHL